jgi:hypothetical protein
VYLEGQGGVHGAPGALKEDAVLLVSSDDDGGAIEISD